jgi:hypothetical protein
MNGTGSADLRWFLPYILGVVSTLVGSWIASKIRVYHDARNAHRDDLKQKVLEPLRNALVSRPTALIFTSEWAAQTYDRRALADQVPTKHGYFLQVSVATLTPIGILDEALFEDACVHHHKQLMGDWQRVASSWTVHVDRCRALIEHMAEEMVRASEIKPYPTEGSTVDPFVMHLKLATFIFARLQGTGQLSLRVERRGNGALLSDGAANPAFGSVEQMESLLAWINAKMKSARPLATRLEQEFAELQADCAKLSREFSLAIAAKKLKRRCPLVRYF